MIEIIEKKPEPLVYPLARKSSINGAVVIFTGLAKGFVVSQGNSDYWIGHYEDNWNPCDYTTWIPVDVIIKG